MNGKFSRLIIAVVALACVALGPSVYASPITGGITFGGAATTDNGNLSLATQFVSFGSPTPVTISSGTGDYTGTAGSNATWIAFSWNPPSTPVANLWSFTIGATSYSFDLNTVSVTISNANLIQLNGSGTAYLSGFDPTPATFVLNGVTFGNPTFSYSPSMTMIPEPASAVLVAMGLFGLFAFHRRRIR